MNGFLQRYLIVNRVTHSEVGLYAPLREHHMVLTQFGLCAANVDSVPKKALVNDKANGEIYCLR
jgi:hypothetical protein